jgi:hypothetical protein
MQISKGLRIRKAMPELIRSDVIRPLANGDTEGQYDAGVSGLLCYGSFSRHPGMKSPAGAGLLIRMYPAGKLGFRTV